MERKSGFTLVEIIMVIILLGILGILGTVGLNSAVSSDRGMYERQLESAIRYAQNYAMSHFTYTAVVFSTAATAGSNPPCSTGSASSSYDGYAVCACNGNTSSSSLQPLANPLAQTADNFYVSMNYGISYNVPGYDSNYIAFNSAGQPGTFPPGTTFPCADISTTFNLSTSTAQISFGSLSNQSFYIYPNTGLVSYNGKL